MSDVSTKLHHFCASAAPLQARIAQTEVALAQVVDAHTFPADPAPALELVAVPSRLGRAVGPAIFLAAAALPALAIGAGHGAGVGVGAVGAGLLFLLEQMEMESALRAAAQSAAVARPPVWRLMLVGVGLGLLSAALPAAVAVARGVGPGWPLIAATLALGAVVGGASVHAAVSRWRGLAGLARSARDAAEEADRLRLRRAHLVRELDALNEELRRVEASDRNPFAVWLAAPGPPVAAPVQSPEPTEDSPVR
ncbi:hypothetical protein L6V77_29315 [Myxococcota bacterium]|nr:hypothetical protein [Myxococcota bacterium]